jgi:hypothetical protein
MEIKIVSRYDSNKVLLCGKYESVKECLEKNKGADLWGAYLRGADLGGADLRGVNLRGADLWGAYLRGADLGGAYLEGAYLWGADLEGVYLEGAYLWGAYFWGAKNYLNSHDFFQEIVKRQPLKDFTEKEWAMIGQILVHRLCWGSIKKRYDKEIIPVFKKLSKVGFQEWEEHYKTV